MIIVFDLDNTLYDEMDYVKSGFRVTARYIHQRWGISMAEALGTMSDTFAKFGRGRVFDAVLENHDRNTKVNVKKCLAIYRAHRPRLKLYPDAQRCLKRLRMFPLYILTDGNKNVQKRKIEGLNLQKLVRRAVITYRFGIERSKPSPYCFLKIAEWECVRPEEVVYVGDNPVKDFVGIKPYGFRTIRIKRGEFSKLKLSPHHEAHLSIDSLDEITPELLEGLVQRG